MSENTDVQKDGFRKCAVEGCGKKVRHRGFCESHYRRMRIYGNPLGGGIDRGQLIKFLEDVAGRSSTESCIEWPYGKRAGGYGTIKFRGKQMRASRAVLILYTGENPGKDSHSLHSCHNRLCVNPRHLRWGSHVENMEDMTMHGTRPRGERIGLAKLTESQVRSIREDSRSNREIAKAYGVSHSCIGAVKSRESWAHVD